MAATGAGDVVVLLTQQFAVWPPLQIHLQSDGVVATKRGGLQAAKKSSTDERTASVKLWIKGALQEDLSVVVHAIGGLLEWFLAGRRCASFFDVDAVIFQWLDFLQGVMQDRTNWLLGGVVAEQSKIAVNRHPVPRLQAR